MGKMTSSDHQGPANTKPSLVSAGLKVFGEL